MDDNRMFEARRFFWEIQDRESRHSPVSVETAQRCIRQIAEALPPFTKIEDSSDVG